MPEHTPAPTPHRAVYGYAFYLLFLTLFVLYTLWAFLPTEQLGLTYLPDKYFAVYLPVLVLVGMFFFEFLIYPAINMSLTADVDEMAAVVDESLVLRHVGEEYAKGSCSWEHLKKAAISAGVMEPKSIYQTKYCEICNVMHVPATQKQIANLRYMDLSEVNDELFK